MNPWNKTLMLVAVAGTLAGLVYFTRPTTQQIALISDQGEPLAPGLTDHVLDVKALEVVSYDDAAAKTRAFKVAFDGKRWTIPSASGYPADASDKVSAAASAFAGLVKERVVSDNKDDHAKLGVLDPSDEAAAAGNAGMGTRVTLRDASDRPLADLIIGKPPKDDAAASPFQTPSTKRYVRIVGKNRVYVTSLQTGFSTKFVDWVQTDLLQTTADQITSIVIDKYQVDAERGITKDPVSIDLKKLPPPAETPGTPPPPPPAAGWSLSATPGGGPGPGQVVNQPRIDSTLQDLIGLKILGVRPKPANLARALGGTAGEVKLTLTDQMSLQSRGFYLGPTGRLMANEGQLAVKCADGVVYGLWFGEVVPDTEDAASGQVGGAATEQAADKPKTPGNARYMMITVSYDSSLAPEPVKSEALKAAEVAFEKAKADFEASKPKAEGEAKPDAAKPEGEAKTTPPAAEAPKEPPDLVSLRQQFENDHSAWKTRVDGGRKRAESLGKRFADWYYVIASDSLAKIRPSREELVKAEEAKKPAAEAGSPELPPGMPMPPIAPGQ